MILLTTIQTTQQGVTGKTLKYVNLKIFKLYHELLFIVIDKLIKADRNINLMSYLGNRFARRTGK